MRAARVSWLLATAALAAGGLSTAQPAAALEPGVHIDPGSPAAKEYALPVTQARRTGADGGSGASAAARGESSETLFGAGIEPRRPGGSSNARAPRSATDAAGAASPAATGTTAALPVVVQHAADTSADPGGSSLLVLLAGAVAVLALGWFGGIVLRRSRRPTPMP